MTLRRQDVNTFKGIDSIVMGRKFAGSLVLPFLSISMVHALFHSEGTLPDNQTQRISSVK